MLSDTDLITRDQVEEHFKGIVKNWSLRWNDELGGFDYGVRSNGETYNRGNRRPLLIHARLLYNFSEALLHGLDEYAAIAERCYTFIYEKMSTEFGWYASVGELKHPGRDERGDRPSEMLDTYDNTFVVIAFAKYKKATGRSDVGEEAVRLLELINKECASADIAENGVRSIGGKIEGTRFGMWGGCSGNTMLHYLEALVNLHEADLGDHKQDIDAVRSLFLKYIYSAEHHMIYDGFRKSFADPYNARGAHGSQGHALEWIDFFRVIDGCALPETVERDLLDHAAQRAIADTGLFVNYYYYTEGKAAGPVDFWGQPEAAKAYNLAADIYGGEYAAIGQRLLKAYFTYFVDEDQGVFYECDRNGVLTDARKGGRWKCDYHSLRMCVDLLDREGGFLSA